MIRIPTLIACGSIFAQVAAPAPMDSVSPWASLLLQGGAFGLVTYIVVKLYPAAAREARAEREARDAMFSTTIQMLQTKFDERSDRIIGSISDQTDTLAASIADSARSIKESVTTACKSK